MKAINGLDDPRLLTSLNSGGVGVIPTDTLYGLVCKASDQTAVKRLYGLKNRENKPGTLVAASAQQLVELGLKARYLNPVSHFWPGPVSVVVPCEPALGYLHLGKQSLAVRVVSDEKLLELLQKTGSLLTSSANHPGEPPADTIKKAQECFDQSLDFYVDGGDLSDRQASTVIRIVDDEVVVLRQGAVKVNDLEEA